MKIPPAHVWIHDRLQPPSRWERATRYLAYEPGLTNTPPLCEREDGRFTFEAASLAALLRARYGDNIGDDPEWQTLHRWLSNADQLDDRTTRLPSGLAFGYWWAELIESGLCRVHCRKCSHRVSVKGIEPGQNEEIGSYQFRAVRCPIGHLLIRLNMIRVCRLPTHPDGPWLEVLKERLAKLSSD